MIVWFFGFSLDADRFLKSCRELKSPVLSHLHDGAFRKTAIILVEFLRVFGFGYVYVDYEG